MIIRPDQIEGVSPEQTRRQNKAQESGQAFGDLLSQEVSKGQAQATSVAPPPMVNPLLNVQAMNQVQATDDSGVTGQVESILDQWDNYAATLADPDSGLKTAYGALDRIADEVAALKEGSTDLAPGLKSIVDDLETMTAAERFKFNRGDYL
ncbi:MAG: flagellar assembly protein FliX [Pseudodesulfovibrio sp.]